MGPYAVDVERCIRCGSCALLAPEIFEVNRKVRLLRQPTDSERARVAVAMLVCPTQAITEAAA